MPYFSIKNSIKNSAWQISEKIFRFLFGFLISTLVIKHLGPTNFGYFSYALTISSFFGLISKFGLDSILVKEFSSNENKNIENELLSNGLAIRIIISFLSVLIVVPLLFFFREDYLIISLVTIFLISNIFQSYELFEALLQSRLKNKISSIIAVCVVLIASIIRVLFLELELSVIYFAIALLIETFLLFAITYLYLKKKKLKIVKPSFEKIKSLINKSLPLLIASLFQFVYLKMDLVMLRHMMNIESVGIYGAAVKVSEILYFIPILISNSFFPILVKNISDKKSFREITSKLMKINFSISFSFIFILFFLATWLVNTLYSPEYAISSDIIKIHVWSILFISLNSICSKLIIIKKKQKVFIKIAILGAIVNILLNTVLIPLYGLYGASYSTLMSYALVSTLIYYNYRKIWLQLFK